MLKKDIRAKSHEIGGAVGEFLGREWTHSSKVRNGQAYRKWTVLLYPNFLIPKAGEENFLHVRSMRTEQKGKGPPPFITEEIVEKIAEMKGNGTSIAAMARELGCVAQTIRNWKRKNPDIWNNL